MASEMSKFPFVPFARVCDKTTLDLIRHDHVLAAETSAQTPGPTRIHLDLLVLVRLNGKRLIRVTFEAVSSVDDWSL